MSEPKLRSQSQKTPQKGSVVGQGWVMAGRKRSRVDCKLWMAICPKCEELATDHLSFFEENDGCLQCTPKNIGKRVQQIESGKIYSTARAAAQLNGFSEMSMHSAIATGKSAPDGCHYTSVDSEHSIPTPKTSAVKRVEKVETGEVWASAHDAAIANGLNPRSIRRFARNGNPYGGFHWCYTNKESNMDASPRRLVDATPASRSETAPSEFPGKYEAGQVLKNGWIVKGKRDSYLYELECPRCHSIVVSVPRTTENQRGCKNCSTGAGQPVKNVQTGQVYPSFAEAADAVGVDRKKFRTHVRRGHAIGGFDWVLVQRGSVY